MEGWHTETRAVSGLFPDHSCLRRVTPLEPLHALKASWVEGLGGPGDSRRTLHAPAACRFQLVVSDIAHGKVACIGWSARFPGEA